MSYLGKEPKMWTSSSQISGYSESTFQGLVAPPRQCTAMSKSFSETRQQTTPLLASNTLYPGSSQCSAVKLTAAFQRAGANNACAPASS
eukprot:2677207-Amphidinium_carterae.1